MHNYSIDQNGNASYFPNNLLEVDDNAADQLEPNNIVNIQDLDIQVDCEISTIDTKLARKFSAKETQIQHLGRRILGNKGNRECSC